MAGTFCVRHLLYTDGNMTEQEKNLPEGAKAEVLHGKGTVVLIDREHRFGQDALLLARFAGIWRNWRVLDLGTGTGILPLLLYDEGFCGNCVALEISPQAAALASRSAQLNELESMQVVCTDLRLFSSERKFDAVLCNPPYFPSGWGKKSASTEKCSARHEINCTLADAAEAARRNLKEGGRFCLCHRPERLAELFSILRQRRLEPKRLQLVRHSPQTAPWLVLVDARKYSRTVSHPKNNCLQRRSGMPGKLYLVPTPIGNLGDLSPRAAEVLGAVDFIAAEDTRVTAKLLNHLGIRKPMVSYHDHNLRERGEQIIARILAGESCAQCSDAGTPAISDPGEVLVRQAIEAGIRVEPIPGPCAAITALCASGIATGRFCFEGFLSVNKKSRRDHLLEISNEQRTMIFYEAPHKLCNTLRDLYETLGDRQITIARELTKLHEEIRRTTLSAANAEYAQREPKGEYVLVVEGAQPAPMTEGHTMEQAVLLARQLIDQGMRPVEACKSAAAQTGYKKSDIYAQLINKE